MIKEILTELRKSAFSVLPIYFLVILLILTGLVSLTGTEILYFSVATFIIIVGIALFNCGAEHSMTPIGRKIGKGLTKQGKTWVLLLVIFIFGFLITFSEPDLSVLSVQTESLFPVMLLILSISVAVGICMLLAVLKIIKKTSLVSILSLLYMVAFALCAIIAFQGKENMIALCFDSGGVTTGPMTVPFLMALGAGVSGVLAQKSEKDASFGFVAFSSIGPIIMMLFLSIFTSGEMTYQLADYSVSDGFFMPFLYAVLEKMMDVGIAMGLILVSFLVINFLFLKGDKKEIFSLVTGILVAYLGLVLFLAAVECTYMSVGFKIGTEISDAPVPVIIIIAFVIGALTVLAEPAIKILTNQVEEVTNGLIKKSSMLIALAIGVGLAIMLSMLRIIFEISILYIVIPGYMLCFLLSFFVPKIYTAIAFDAGGVASGPLTSSFILPIALGVCSSVLGEAGILTYGFGVVSLVALSPLLSIEILGVVSVILNQIRIKSSIRKVLKEDDKLIIKFGE